MFLFNLELSPFFMDSTVVSIKHLAIHVHVASAGFFVSLGSYAIEREQYNLYTVKLKTYNSDFQHTKLYPS